MRLFAALTMLLLAWPARAQKVEFKTDEQKTLYVMGQLLGRDLSPFNIGAGEIKFIVEGLTDYVKGAKPQFKLEEFGPKVGELRQKRSAAASEGEKKKAKAFLEKAAKDKGAVQSPSGLVFVEMKAGAGASPKATDNVKVHYHGTLIDGTVFDSSVQRGEPATFPLNGVIPCWTEGVQKMKVGGKAKLICPSSIAYGDRGSPPVIKGGAALIFEVELLEILKQPETGASSNQPAQDSKSPAEKEKAAGAAQNAGTILLATVKGDGASR